MAKNEAQQRKTVSLATSFGVHAVLVLLAWFFLRLTPPNPPWSSPGGVGVNFGTSDEGFGVDPATENVTPIQSPDPQPSQQPSPTQPTEEAAINTGTEDSPVEVSDKKGTTEPTKPVTNPDLDYQKPTNSGGGTSNGNKEGTTGDMGQKGGSLDNLNYEGAPGKGSGGFGGDGSSLQLTGWRWDEKPNVDDKTSETGKIRFEIKVNDQGEILNIRTVESTVSPAIERKYRDAVQQLSFSRTRDNTKPAAISTGTITFVLRAQ